MIFDKHIGPTNLSPDSRVWIYQAARILSSEEIEIIQKELQTFIPGWTAHDELLEAAGGIHKNLFVIFIADQTRTGASGCSIDKSFKLIQEFERKLDVQFLNRTNVAYLDQEMLKVCSADDFSTLVKQDQISAQTPVFNNLVSSLSELETNWEIPFADSWHQSFFR